MKSGGNRVKNLKALRRERGVSQQKLAEHIGTNQQSIHRYEHGYYEPDIGTLKQLALFFETSIDYLVGATDIRHKIESVEAYELNADESALIDKVRMLTPRQRKSVAVFLDTLLGCRGEL
jgi:transcriptional regulator with XRE-family HTH domain